MKQNMLLLSLALVSGLVGHSLSFSRHRNIPAGPVDLVRMDANLELRKQIITPLKLRDAAFGEPLDSHSKKVTPLVASNPLDYVRR